MTRSSEPSDSRPGRSGVARLRDHIRGASSEIHEATLWEGRWGVRHVGIEIVAHVRIEEVEDTVVSCRLKKGRIVRRLRMVAGREKRVACCED